MSEHWKLDRLRAHPENATIFGDPEEDDAFDVILSSVKRLGIIEPLAVKADGTIISGHLRYAVATRLRLETVPVRVVEPFKNYRDEVEVVIRHNTDRRQMSKGQIGIAFSRLRQLPKAEGGTKRPRGGDRKSADAKNQTSASGHLKSRGDEEAAELLGIGKHEARALETVFTTPGVPEELKAAVNRGDVAPTPAAKAIRTEVKRQGGELKDTAPLQAVAKPAPKPAKSEPEPETHEQRIAREARAYEADYVVLWELYKKLDGVLTRRPPKTVLGPTEHHQYAGLVRDVALRAWREIEAIHGQTEAGKQMTLTVLSGGKS